MTMSAALDATRRLDWRHIRARRNCAARLLSRLRRDTIVHMLERRHGYFPEIFVWQGRRHEVSAVERCWTVRRRRLRGEAEHHYFRVRARSGPSGTDADGTLIIYQNLDDASWHMRRRVV